LFGFLFIGYYLIPIGCCLFMSPYPQQEKQVHHSSRSPHGSLYSFFHQLFLRVASARVLAGRCTTQKSLPRYRQAEIFQRSQPNPVPLL
jgi:hypothetical protein